MAIYLSMPYDFMKNNNHLKVVRGRLPIGIILFAWCNSCIASVLQFSAAWSRLCLQWVPEQFIWMEDSFLLDQQVSKQLSSVTFRGYCSLQLQTIRKIKMNFCWNPSLVSRLIFHLSKGAILIWQVIKTSPEKLNIRDSYFTFLGGWSKK